MAYLTLKLPHDELVVTGKQVTFESPCSSEGLTGVIVDGNTYDLVNLKGEPLDAGSFSRGALVSILLHAGQRKAYFQTVAVEEYKKSIEEELKEMQEHMNGEENPHNVTATQISISKTTATQLNVPEGTSVDAVLPDFMLKSGGRFTGKVYAGGTGTQTPNEYLIRNQRLLSIDSANASTYYPTVEGAICWIYE